ncbi:16S rRNA processing protein RimM [Pontibacter ummariensis]|uniref:Ribosome maturation factor RimM n=1 Tax=Pontibacter ummariensis TaxID=1610492 RepID=A0A239BCH3_9BACT|nr:ribosome maturation factor RimM [Pontibacter ummariensis]PRY16452.1 16S rRNA processing protein RimM [Pontibacter ummariensis]SNS05399.1 16S rRNA processing protein RimM [Pontibacter ummariensis]
MTIDDSFLLGYIVKTHGTRGQVVAFFDVDYPEDYEELESVFLEQKGRLVPFFITSMTPIKESRFIITFEDVKTIEQAEALRGVSLYLPLDELPELEEDQFYFHEVIGYTVVDEHHGQLGTVKEFYDLPQQQLMAMDYMDQEMLIPVIDEIFLRADHEAKQLHVNLPEGLLDVYTQPTSPDEADDEDNSEEDQ